MDARAPCHLAILVMWVLWCLYWLASALRVKRTARRESLLSRLSHILPVGCGVWLIFAPLRHPAWFAAPLLPPAAGRCAAAALLVALGLLFSVWARVQLGRNWSASVTAKADHELVRSGPYAWVRHPIYTGLLLALLGEALDAATLRALLGLALAAAGFVHKLRIEEGFMERLFGSDYLRYRAEVPALLPLRAARRSAPR